jgi:hypothetical protein
MSGTTIVFIGVKMLGNEAKNTLKDFLFKISKPQLSKIHKFKDIHKGEDGYFFGNGISIKWFDLKQFSDKTSIGTSFIPFHQSFHDLNLQYILLHEPFWFYPAFWTKYFVSNTSQPKTMKAFRKIILENPDKDFFIDLTNFPVLRSQNVNFLFQKIEDARLPNDFITNQIDSYSGGMKAGITMAIYMGFKHIYLVGCDYTHSKTRALHFYEKGKGFDYNLPSYEEEFLSAAKEFIDITTITTDGKGDLLNSITYRNHTGCEPIFQENDQLVDKKYLEALNEWHNYSIFWNRTSIEQQEQ